MGRNLGSAVLLWKVSFLELLPYWHRTAYSGLLWRERIITVPQLTVSCSVHSVTELAGVEQILLKLCLRLFPEWDFEDTTLTESERWLSLSLYKRIIHNSTDIRKNKSTCRVDIKPFSCFILPCKK